MSCHRDDWSSGDRGWVRLSGRVVGQLSLFEQFVLWALRRRLSDGCTTSAVLVRGFRLAFGLAYLERALAAFETVCTCLEAHGTRDIGLLPLSCACISSDEAWILALVRAAPQGGGASLARALVGSAAAELSAAAAELAELWECAGCGCDDLGGPCPARDARFRSATARSSRCRFSR